MWIWIWLGVIVATAVVEFITMEMVSVWCCFGGLVALILAGCKVGVEIQIIVFFAISIILLLSLRKIVLKYLNKSGDNAKILVTDKAIGKSFKLLTDIKNGAGGTIKVNGIEWTACTDDDKNIKTGTLVKVLKLSGNKYIVEKIVEKKEEK